MSIIVYSTKSCGQCVATVKALERKGIPFQKVDASDDVDTISHLKSLGFMQFPVVMAGDQSWAGFRPDMISKLAA